MRVGPYVGVAILLTPLLLATGAPAPAQSGESGAGEIETQDIFGFTEGTGIGEAGQRQLSLDTDARIGKKDGRYFASDSKLEFEFTPNRYVEIGFGPFLSAYRIKGIPDLDDRNETAFGGLFGELRYLLLDRGPASPLALTLSAEPQWRRLDETSGAHVQNFQLELKASADLELVKDRLYLGANFLYQPEATRDPDQIGAGWAMESQGGVSVALAWRAWPSALIGAEVWYLRQHDGAWFNAFTGDATFVGPTLFVQLSPTASMAAAWNVQVRGSDVADPAAKLNLSEFSRQRAKLKIAIEF